MPESDMIAAIKAYLDLVVRPPDSSERRLSLLAEILDRLATIYHDISETDLHYDVSDISHDSYAAAHKAMGQRFPELGFYSTVESKAVPASSITADAIDDLVDIVAELQDVMALWESGAQQDAFNQYRAGYRFHWGRHLQDLRGHLHAMLHER
jgi:hypothetical protein